MDIELIALGFGLVAAVLGWLIKAIMNNRERINTIWTFIFGDPRIKEVEGRPSLVEHLKRIEREVRELRRQNEKGSDSDAGGRSDQA